MVALRLALSSRGAADSEGELAFVHVDTHLLPRLELAAQEHAREPVIQLALGGAAQGMGTKFRLIAPAGKEPLEEIAEGTAAEVTPLTLHGG